MKFKAILAATAVAMMPAVASAITLTGEAVNAFGENESGTVVIDTANAVNPANLDLGPVPAEFNVNVGVANSGPGGFTATQKYTNKSGSDLVFTISTLLTASDFSGAALAFSLDDVTYTTFGNNVFATSGGTGETFTVADGSMFWIRASATDVISSGNFDYNLAATPIPVPAGILLMGTALAGFGVMRRRKKAA